MQRLSRRTTQVLICALLLVLVAGCVPPPTPTPSPAATPTASEDPRTSCRETALAGLQAQREVPQGLELSPYAGLMYVDRQVLVGGTRDAMKAFDDSIARTKLPIQPYAKGDPEIPAGEDVIRLYRIQEKTGPEYSVEYTTCLINRLSGKGLPPVYADPNYTVTPAGWHGGGSPWTQNGAWAQDGGGLGSTDLKGFTGQWALGKQGIALFDAAGSRLTEAEGKGIVIGVFDTAPAMDSLSSETFFESAFGDSLSLQEADPASGQLFVHDAKPQDVPECPGHDRTNPSIQREDYDLSSHGLFVASLAHAVAPQSNIYLVKVLGKDACGDLATILRGMDWFQQTMVKAKQPMDKTVINLSLGLNRPDEEQAKAFGLPAGAEVKTLQKKIESLTREGSTVVAAAGNDSFDQAIAGEAEIPANDRPVIGVAASNADGQRSCFSNQGDLAAPGGDGVGPDSKPSAKRLGAGDKPLCLVPGQIPSSGVMPPKPTDPWVCELDATPCVAGLVWRNGKAQFAYWVGTSFATPMVSGLAALAAETKPPNRSVAQVIGAGLTAVDPSESLGGGIINVDQSMPN